MVGHLHYLWWWTLDMSLETGDLSRCSPTAIAAAAMWEGDPNQFVDVLIDVGFIDRSPDGMKLHDWGDYTEKLVEGRKKAAEHSQRYRDKQRAARAPQSWPETSGDATPARQPDVNITSASRQGLTVTQPLPEPKPDPEERKPVPDPRADAPAQPADSSLSPVPKSQSARAPADNAEFRAFVEQLSQAFPLRGGVHPAWDEAVEAARRLPAEDWPEVVEAARRYAQHPDVVAGFPRHAVNWLPDWRNWANYQPPPPAAERSRQGAGKRNSAQREEDNLLAIAAARNARRGGGPDPQNPSGLESAHADAGGVGAKGRLLGGGAPPAASDGSRRSLPASARRT